MILDQHERAQSPRLLEKLSGRRALGYWRSEEKPDLPDPGEFLDPTWDPQERARVVAYLVAGEVAVQWRGLSWCRLCDLQTNGSRCLFDEAFVWPEGLAHYLEVHALRPPDEFVQHVLSKLDS